MSKLLASLMRNYFPKRPSGAPLHTLSKLYDVPVGFEPPPPLFWLNIAYFAVAEGWLLLDIGWFVLFLWPSCGKPSLPPRVCVIGHADQASTTRHSTNPFPNVTRHSGEWPYTVTPSIGETLHQFFYPLLIWTSLLNLTFCLIVWGFHRRFATGAPYQQKTLTCTPADTWSCPTLGLAYVLMSRQISPELILFPDFWVSNIPRYFCFSLKLFLGQWSKSRSQGMTLVSFERASFVEYALQIWSLYLERFKSYSEG